MIPLPLLTQRSYIVGAMLAIVVVAGGLTLHRGYRPLAQAVGAVSSASAKPAGTAYLAQGAAASTTRPEPVREVHIANTGLALLRGARVLSVSGNTVILGMAWGASEFTWAVEMQYSTKFIGANGEKSSFSDIHAGDVVTITGTITQGGERPYLRATIVRKSG